VLFLLLALAGSVARVAAGGRTQLDLSGTWQYQNVSQLSYPPSNNWQTITVPGFLSGWQYDHAWFRCLFSLPSSFAGTQLKLRFGGAKFNSQVWLNGTAVGSYLNGYEPFEFDITSLAQPGQTNELIVGVTDWTATFSTPVDFSNLPANEDPRDYVQDVILAPIGGYYYLYGIWQPVTVVSEPAVAIENVLVMPSVRSQQLTVRLNLRNDGAAAQTVSLTNLVLDGATAALALPVHQVPVPPGGLSLDIVTAWTNAHWWSHLDPYLYTLQTTLAAGTTQDQVQTRFGFREFWATNGMFFLNGIPINLRATATWPPEDLQASNSIAQTLLQVKAANTVAMRLHTQPWDESWYDIADQIGLLIVEECAVWCDPYAYRLSDPVFWTNYSQHIAAAVQRDWNHPSIVAWSLENEILSCGGYQVFSGTPAQLAAMGRLLKSLDPTRPITYESDLDPDGETDILGLHYPHEFPNYQCWPNEAWWMNQPIPRSWMPGGEWTWDHSKPLYIGEFLFMPSTMAGGFTVLYGDEAYTDPDGYRYPAKGLIWRMQIEAFRAYGVNGISPYTMFEDPAFSWGAYNLNPPSNCLYQVQQEAYQFNDAFVEEYNPRFFTGDTITRTAHLFNDRPVTNNLTLSWSAGGAWRSDSVTLPPAGQWSGAISFTAPAAPGPFSLQLEVDNGGSVVFANNYSYSAQTRPVLSLPSGAVLGLYDPAGRTSNLLGRFDLPFIPVADLHASSSNQFNLLIIGQGALANEPVPEVGQGSLWAQWQNFMARGGWMLVLEQTNYPAWMPLTIQNFDATFAFPNTNCPAMLGLTPDDLRWWAGDHRVVANALAAPVQGNFRILASIGSTNGLENAAVVEELFGKGGLLCSQFLLAEKFDTEPMAGALLQRLLNECAPGAVHPALHPTALVAETNSPAAATLGTLGLQCENFLGRLTNCDPVLYPVLMLAGSNTVWQEAVACVSNLAAYAQAGGTLLLHRPDSTFLAAAQPVLFPELTPSEVALGKVLRRDSTNAAVHLFNHDLYWIAQPGNWNQAEVLSTNIASRCYHLSFDLLPSTYGIIMAADMPIHSTGYASAGGWWLDQNGYAAQNIVITEPGTYLFNIRASGTPAFGGWPQMLLQIDGQVWDSTYVPTNFLSFYTLSADLAPGTHQLAIVYDNDAWNPPTEDRNLFLYEIQWGRKPDSDPATLLTLPGAVAQVRSGNGLIVLDEIAWETETQNATKAQRYASTLLTGLGAAMTQPLALGIEATSMTNVNVASYDVVGGVAWVNSNGRIQAPVHFTESGYYTFDVIAGGMAAMGVLPEVAVVVDGVNRAIFFETSTNLTHYRVTLVISAGTHTIGLGFLNDYYAPPQDRNAAFGRLTILPQTAPQITALETDPTHQAATLQWQATPGKTYEVQVAPSLNPANWQTVTNFICTDTMASWQDTGSSSNAPPLSPAAPRRFYRVGQVGP
jgi:hypothetical protein